MEQTHMVKTTRLDRVRRDYSIGPLTLHESPHLVFAGGHRPHFVVWHSLGSNCCDGFTKEFIDMLQKEMPQAKVISIRVGSSQATDSYKSYFDDANRQVDEVCSTLKRDPALKNGFNAIGLSQGGLLLRALVEKCSGLKVNRLITFGSPLQGVAAYPGCGQGETWAKISPMRIINSIMKRAREQLIPCSVLNGLVGRSIYTERAQSSVMPAQYFKDPSNIKEYLKMNKFLTDINNELPRKNPTYKENFKRLDRLVVYSFEEEEVVYPKESTNFGYFDGSKKILPMRETPLYKEDWIGLKELDKRGAIVQIRLPGEHLNINESVIRSLIPYLTDNK